MMVSLFHAMGGGIFSTLLSHLTRTYVLIFSQQSLFRIIMWTRPTQEHCNSAFVVWRNLEFVLGSTTRKIWIDHNILHILHMVFAIFLDNIHPYDFWVTITNRVSESGTSQESGIRSPIHHFIHRLVTFSGNHKKAVTKYLGRIYFMFGESLLRMFSTIFLTRSPRSFLCCLLMLRMSVGWNRFHSQFPEN